MPVPSNSQIVEGAALFVGYAVLLLTMVSGAHASYTRQTGARAARARAKSEIAERVRF